MRARSLGLAIAMTLPLFVAAGPASAAAPWTGSSSMLGGTVRYDSGEWISQDFIYDDYGADTEPAGASQRVSLAATKGDFRYPTDPKYAGNAADIMEVRARAEGGDLRVRVTLNTLLDPAAAVIAAAVTSVQQAPTDVPDPINDWPFKAGVRSPWYRLATVANGQVKLSRPTGSPSNGPAPVVDTTANTVEFVITAALPAGRNRVGLTVASGLWDAAGGQWLAGQPGNSPSATAYSTGLPTDGRVFDVAGNTNDLEPEGGNWREDFQSAQLQTRFAGRFMQVIDLGKLRSGAVDEPILAPGFYDRIFVSNQPIEEGVRSSFPQYGGKWQTYGLWVPKSYDPSRPTPLVLVLHSLSVHHNQYAGSNVYRQLGDDLDALAITPLGRGPDGWYWDEGLIDTLEAWNDVRANYNVDDDRTVSSGYSMGGYATYRLATLMPDRLAGAVSWVGPPAYQLWAYPLDPTPSGARQRPGNTYSQLENVEHIPFMIVHGTNDELVPVAGVLHQAERFRELRYDYRFALHPGQDHLSFAVLDDWTRERDFLRPLLARGRDKDPAHVVFKVRPASWATPGRADAASLLAQLGAQGANLSSAYWVRNVDVAGTGDVTGVVDLTSDGRGALSPAVAYATSQSVEAGPPSPFLLRTGGRGQGLGEAADVLRGNLNGVRELTVDVDRAGLTLDAEVRVTSDIPAVLHLVSSEGGSRDVDIAATVVAPA